MRPITYEIRRTLTSKFVILMIVAIIGLSSLLAYESAATFHSAPLASRIPSVSYGYYQSGENVTIVTYSYEPSGLPYKGLNLYFNSQNDTTYGAVSNNFGYANVTMPYNSTSLNPITMNYTYSIFGRSVSVPKSTLSINPFIPYTGYEIIPGLRDSSNSSSLGFQILYVGANGTSAPDTSVYVATYQKGDNTSTVISNSSYTENVTGFTVYNVFPGVGGELYNSTFALVLVSNGTDVTPKMTPGSPPLTPYVVGKLSLYKPMTQEGLQSLVFSGIGPILNYLIPILGIFAAYLTYGKDRTTGVLESVLKRPVTRSGLISSRFVANSVSIVVSVIVSMIVGDLIIQHYFHMGLTGHFILFFIWTYVVEGLSFLAIIYMFTHIVRSQGALLGVSIAIFVVYALFWAIIPATILVVFGVSSASSEYISANVAFNYASPSGYSSLVQFFFTKSLGLFSTTTANPAFYGVTQTLLLVAGVLWIAVPFLIAFNLARKYD